MSSPVKETSQSQAEFSWKEKKCPSFRKNLLFTWKDLFTVSFPKPKQVFCTGKSKWILIRRLFCFSTALRGRSTSVLLNCFLCWELDLFSKCKNDSGKNCIFCRSEKDKIFVFDGIGDLSNQISAKDDAFYSTANVLLLVFRCDENSSVVLLNQHFSFKGIFHKISFLHIQKGFSRKIVLPSETNEILQTGTIVKTQGYITRNGTYKYLNMTATAFNYSGQFSTHSSDFGGGFQVCFVSFFTIAPCLNQCVFSTVYIVHYFCSSWISILQ